MDREVPARIICPTREARETKPTQPSTLRLPSRRWPGSSTVDAATHPPARLRQRHRASGLSRYRNLFDETASSLAACAIHMLWVHQDGSVDGLNALNEAPREPRRRLLANPPTGRFDVHTPQTRKEDCTLSYWWVNQGENFERAIKAHTLWTLQDREASGPLDAGNLELRPGDIVIHHARKAIRAVSQVAEAATSATRPAEPRTHPDLVRAGIGRATRRAGHPAPRHDSPGRNTPPSSATAAGPPDHWGRRHRQTPLPEQIDTRTAHAILAARGVEAPDLAPLPSAWADGIDATDSEALTKARPEQSCSAFLLGTSPTATYDPVAASCQST